MTIDQSMIYVCCAMVSFYHLSSFSFLFVIPLTRTQFVVYTIYNRYLSGGESKANLFIIILLIQRIENRPMNHDLIKECIRGRFKHTSTKNVSKF